MKYLIILLLCSCTVIPVFPEIQGSYFVDGFEITFDKGIIVGKTECNLVNGTYSIFENKINIYLLSTKIYCDGEFYVYNLNGDFEYTLNNNLLILYNESSNVELVKN